MGAVCTAPGGGMLGAQERGDFDHLWGVGLWQEPHPGLPGRGPVVTVIS